MSSASPAAPFHEPDAPSFFFASGFTGGLPANFGGISISAIVMSTGTGFKSLPCASSPRRCASSGIDPPPQNGSYTGGGLPPVDLRISARALFSTRSSLEFSHFTNSRMMLNNRSRSISTMTSSSFGSNPGSRTDFMPAPRALSNIAFSCVQAFLRVLSSFSAAARLPASPSNSFKHSDGSSTSEANSTARQAASGRLAHHKCNVDGCPCRMDFSRAASRLMSSSGSATSISFFR